MKADTIDVVEVMARAMHQASGIPNSDDMKTRLSLPYRDMSRSALEAIRSAGYVVVPVEPTEAMVEAGSQDFSGDMVTKRGAIDIYRAMIEAAE